MINFSGVRKHFCETKPIRTVVSYWLIGIDDHRIALRSVNGQGIDQYRLCFNTVGLDDGHVVIIDGDGVAVSLTLLGCIRRH